MTDSCVELLQNSALAVLFHPFTYANTLVQVGHEPLPPTLGRNWTLRRTRMLPGPLAYIKHMAKVEGKAGLFLNGLVPSLCAETAGTVVYSAILRKLQGADVRPATTGDDQRRPEDDESPLRRLVNETAKAMIASSCATVAAHPFRVVALRCMVQFIGRETKYSGLFGSTLTIYREEGIRGFFAGLVPRLLAGALTIWLGNLLAHLVTSYAIDDSTSHTAEIRAGVRAVAGAVSAQLFSPLVLASNLMAVNNCGLAAGLPPYASGYTTWMGCLRRLYTEGNMYRGLGIFRKAPGV